MNKEIGAAGSNSSTGEVTTYYLIGKDMCKLNSDRFGLNRIYTKLKVPAVWNFEHLEATLLSRVHARLSSCQVTATMRDPLQLWLRDRAVPEPTL